MGFGYKSFLEGIRLVPVSSTGITLKGDLEVLSSSGKINYFNGASASPLVSEAHSATLTNKTFNAPDNTLTNITNTNISASAGIVYSKLSLTGSIVNADINASAAIALSKLGATTADRVIISDGSGFLTVATTTSTQIGFLSAATGTTGTTSSNLVFSASPTLTGTLNAAIGNFSSQVLSGSHLTVKAGSELRLNNPGDTFYAGFKSQNVSSNTIWSLPLADGTVGQVLKTNGSKILDWVSVNTAIGNSYIIVTTGAAVAHGTTDNKIRRFSVTESSAGSDITYTSDPSTVLGDTFTINTTGLYSVVYTDQSSVGIAQIGISVNSADLTTAIVSISAADRKALSVTVGASLPTQVTAVLYLTASSVIRAHDDGTLNSTASGTSRIEVRRIGT